ELARGCARGRLDLVLLELDAERTELVRQLRARPGRAVRDEAEGVRGRAERRHRLRRAGDRLTGDVQHPVDVEENARHGAGVYSCHALGLARPGRDRAAGLALVGPRGPG